MNAVPFMGIYDVDLFDCPPFKMFTVGDCPRADNILLEKSFEPHSMRLWCQQVRKASCILDIGCHVGVYSLAAATLRNDIGIHAFDANPYAMARLKVHKRLNKLPHITEHLCALGASIGIAKFGWTVKPTQQISSGGKLGVYASFPGMTVESVLCEMLTLDHLILLAKIGLGNRALVKIDVEGAENLVISGAKTLLKHRPDIIIESFNAGNCMQITSDLPIGFTVFKIHESGELEKLERLTAADPKGRDFNQLITWRPEEFT